MSDRAVHSQCLLAIFAYFFPVWPHSRLHTWPGTPEFYNDQIENAYMARALYATSKQ